MLPVIIDGIDIEGIDMGICIAGFMSYILVRYPVVMGLYPLDLTVQWITAAYSELE